MDKRVVVVDDDDADDNDNGDGDDAYDLVCVTNRCSANRDVRDTKP
jgi:hypothetical protein